MTTRRAESAIHSTNRDGMPTPMNRLGATPTTVIGTPFTRMEEPITPGLFPKSCSPAV